METVRQENDVVFERGTDRFNLRAAAVIVRRGRLLVQRQTTDDFYFLPGGRVGFHESSDEAVRREIREELDAELVTDRLLWVVENFFHIRERDVHEIGHYWLGSIVEAGLPPESPVRQDSFRITDGGLFEFRWVALDEIGQMPLYPEFLRSRIASLPKHTELIVQREEQADE